MKMRSATLVGSLMLVSAAISTIGCGSNTPSTSSGTGGVTGSGGSTPVTETGGSTAPAVDAGGSPPPITGADGSASTDGTTSSTFTPLCAGLTTAGGAVPTKGGTCTATDPSLCYKTCGPQSIGFKSETCPSGGGTYAEQSGCSFLPTGDYSCYKLPATADPTCPTVAPQASTACTVATCVVCGGTATAQTTGYLDSTGAAKAGFCVCPAAGAGGTSKWSCASTTAWPCPQCTGC